MWGPMTQSIQPYVIRRRALPPRKARFAWWLAAAVFLHGPLLLIPARLHLARTPALQALSVTLSTGWRPLPPTRPTESALGDRSTEAPRQAPQGSPPARSARSFAAPGAPPSPPPGAAAGENDARAPVTLARLLDDARRREWGLPKPPAPPRLGQHAPPPPDPRPVAPATSVTQSSAAGPSRAGIVDQWVAADGSRNRMIRTPSGDLLCGRVEAWSPLNPLFEPVMTYRACGAGRPTFEMPPRVLLR